MKVEKHKVKKQPYTKPEVYTHEPLRNITADGPGGGNEPTCVNFPGVCNK